MNEATFRKAGVFILVEIRMIFDVHRRFRAGELTQSQALAELQDINDFFSSLARKEFSNVT